MEKKTSLFNNGSNNSKAEAKRRREEFEKRKPVMSLVNVYSFRLIICILIIGFMVMQLITSIFESKNAASHTMEIVNYTLQMASGLIMLFLVSHQSKYRPDVEDELAKENLNKAREILNKAILIISLLIFMPGFFLNTSTVITVPIKSILFALMILIYVFLAAEYLLFIHYEKKGNSNTDEEEE